MKNERLKFGLGKTCSRRPLTAPARTQVMMHRDTINNHTAAFWAGRLYLIAFSGYSLAWMDTVSKYSLYLGCPKHA